MKITRIIKLITLLVVILFTGVAANAAMDYFYEAKWEMTSADLKALGTPPQMWSSSGGTFMEYMTKIGDYYANLVYVFTPVDEATGADEMAELNISFQLDDMDDARFDALVQTVRAQIEDPADPFKVSKRFTGNEVEGYTRHYQQWLNRELFIELIEMRPLAEGEYELLMNVMRTKFFEAEEYFNQYY